MKRIKCPKCDRYIIFDETKYGKGQSLVFECQNCGKQFRVKIGVTQLQKIHEEKFIDESTTIGSYGCIVVIENVFHYKQVFPLQLGNNIIGRYMKGSKANIPIETNDPSIDICHCVINVSNDKKGLTKYILRDGPSNTGTFVDNEILGDRERRVLNDGSLFTIGATSIILKVQQKG
mgnify:CR=1 FL=1